MMTDLKTCELSDLLDEYFKTKQQLREYDEYREAGLVTDADTRQQLIDSQWMSAITYEIERRAGA